MSFVQLSPFASAFATGAYTIPHFASAAPHIDGTIIALGCHQPGISSANNGYDEIRGVTTARCGSGLLAQGPNLADAAGFSELPLVSSISPLQATTANESSLPQKIAMIMLAGGLTACSSNESGLGYIAVMLVSAVTLFLASSALDALRPHLVRFVRSLQFVRWIKGKKDDSTKRRLKASLDADPTLDQVLLLKKSIKSPEVLTAFLDHALKRGIFQTLAAFIKLTKCAVSSLSHVNEYRKATVLNDFVRAHLDEFFALGPRLSQVRTLEEGRAWDISTRVAILKKALSVGLVQTPDDFLMLIKNAVPDRYGASRMTIDDFVPAHLDEFFALGPRLDQVQVAQTQIAWEEINLAIMAKAWAAGLVQTPDDFLTLTKNAVSDRYGASRMTTDGFVRAHLDEFFVLGPRLSQVRTLAEGRVWDIRTRVAILKKALSVGLVQTPDNFLTLTEYNDPYPTEVYRDAIATFIVEHLDSFLQLDPSADHIKTLVYRIDRVDWIQPIITILTNEASQPQAMRAAIAAEMRKRQSLMRDFEQAILESNMGDALIQRVRREGYDPTTLIITALSKVSPTSSKTFIQTRTDKIKLVKQLLSIGDIREHLPHSWRASPQKTFPIMGGHWAITEGEKVDASGHVRALVNLLRAKTSARDETAEQSLVAELRAYLASEKTEQEREELRDHLYAYAAQDEVIHGTINIIHEREYEGLDALEGFFETDGPMSKVIGQVFRQLPPEALQGNGDNGTRDKILHNPSSVAARLKKIWEAVMPIERKQAIIGGMLQQVREDEIREKLLSRDDFESELRETCERALSSEWSTTRQKIEQELLAPVLEIIRREKAKFTYQERAVATIGIKPVKGIVDGMYGLSTGVCTAKNIKIWENQKFTLFAITHEDEGNIVGYVQALEVMVDGKRHLTLPGINPSHEFLHGVDGEALYHGIITQVIQFAEAAGFEAVTIPVNRYINSNRARFQKIIARLGQAGEYQKIKIPVVKWTFTNNYRFNKVYLVWERSDELLAVNE